MSRADEALGPLSPGSPTPPTPSATLPVTGDRETPDFCSKNQWKVKQPGDEASMSQRKNQDQSQRQHPG